MKRLTIGKHDVVRNVNNIIDGTQTYGRQARLQPFGRLLYLAVSNADAGIAATSLAVLNHHIDGKVVVVDDEIVDRWTVERGFVTVLLHPGIEVAGNAPVA